MININKITSRQKLIIAKGLLDYQYIMDNWHTNSMDFQEVYYDFYLKARLVNEKIGMILYPPVPSPINKVKNKYRWRIIIKCKFEQNMIELMEDMLEEYYNMKTTDTRVIVDVNPNNMSY